MNCIQLLLQVSLHTHPNHLNTLKHSSDTKEARTLSKTLYCSKHQDPEHISQEE